MIFDNFNEDSDLLLTCSTNSIIHFSNELNTNTEL